MTNYLVVTIMGRDRPGLVNQLTMLASDNDCNIVDSRMALFGNELSLIMMLSGSWSSITKIETSLPSLSAELELMTIMKRTSKHEPKNYPTRIEVTLNGQDQRGTMKTLTQFLTERGLDIAAVRSYSETSQAGELSQYIYLAINIPEKVPLDKLEQNLTELAESMALTCSINRKQDTHLQSDKF